MKDPIAAVIDLLEAAPPFAGLPVFADWDPEHGEPAFPYVILEAAGGVPDPVAGGPDLRRPIIHTSIYGTSRAQVSALGKAAFDRLGWAKPGLGPGGEAVMLIPTAEPFTSRDPDPGPANESVWRCLLTHTFLYQETS